MNLTISSSCSLQTKRLQFNIGSLKINYDASMTKSFLERHGNIAVYIPNLIGYLRVVCAYGALGVASNQPLTCVFLYFISFVCDELDGRAARAFNQGSTFGAVLDMLTDRLATTGLLVLLCLRYPEWYMLFLSLIMLDILSHWLQMYSSLVAGDISHKQTFNQSWLVRQYYSHRLFMGFCCVCCEVLYLALYLLSNNRFWEPPVLAGRPGQKDWPVAAIVAAGALAGFIIKQLVNVAQIRAACSALILLDQQRDKKASPKAA